MDKNTKPVYMLSLRDQLQTQGQIQTESEELEKGSPCKYESKESCSSNTHMRQNRLWNKDH